MADSKWASAKWLPDDFRERVTTQKMATDEEAHAFDQFRDEISAGILGRDDVLSKFRLIRAGWEAGRIWAGQQIEKRADEWVDGPPVSLEEVEQITTLGEQLGIHTDGKSFAEAVMAFADDYAQQVGEHSLMYFPELTRLDEVVAEFTIADNPYAAARIPAEYWVRQGRPAEVIIIVPKEARK